MFKTPPNTSMLIKLSCHVMSQQHRGHVEADSIRLRILENCAGHLPYFLQLFLCNAHEKDILYLLKCWEEEKVELSYDGLNLLISLLFIRNVLHICFDFCLSKCLYYTICFPDVFPDCLIV